MPPNLSLNFFGTDLSVRSTVAGTLTSSSPAYTVLSFGLESSSIDQSQYLDSPSSYHPESAACELCWIQFVDFDSTFFSPLSESFMLRFGRFGYCFFDLTSHDGCFHLISRVDSVLERQSWRYMILTAAFDIITLLYSEIAA